MASIQDTLPAAAPAAPFANDTANTSDVPVKTPRPKSTFMLHDPTTFASLGKYVSTDARYSALKAASRGIEDIYLRKTNSKIVYHYTGSVVNLDEPQIVMRGKRQIQYTKKPVVKFRGKSVYDGDISKLDAQEEEVEVKVTRKAKKAKTGEHVGEESSPVV